MRLTALSYKTADWELKDIEFEELSLIVGKNATGKTRTLGVLQLLYEIICQKSQLTAGEWDIRFFNGSDNFHYKFEIRIGENGYFLKEKMIINDELFFERNEGSFQIKNVLTKNLETSYPPSNKLVIHVARDVRKYPYIEEVVRWAEQSFGFKFSSVYPKNGLDSADYGMLSGNDPVSKLWLQLKGENRDKVRLELVEIGFPVEAIRIHLISPNYNSIVLTEENVDSSIVQHEVSQGMFRSLAVLIFAENLVSEKSTATIIIDDLCEGLDYERATKLGKLLFEKCLANNIQLIATSNDMFLMDVVDLKYWNVLQRNGQVVTAINAKNHPSLFEDFKFTGLSNFDFFASDYIAQNL